MGKALSSSTANHIPKLWRYPIGIKVHDSLAQVISRQAVYVVPGLSDYSGSARQEYACMKIRLKSSSAYYRNTVLPEGP